MSNKTYKFGRKNKPRALMVRNLATSLIMYEKITTTIQKAKVIKSYIDKVLSTAITNELSSKRQVARMLSNKKAVAKIFDIGIKNLKEIDKKSGYSFMIKNEERKGDSALETILILDPDIFNLKQEKNIIDDNDKSKKKK